MSLSHLAHSLTKTGQLQATATAAEWSASTARNRTTRPGGSEASPSAASKGRSPTGPPSRPQVHPRQSTLQRRTGAQALAIRRSGGNANFAWVQHMVHHLAPGGVAGFVLAKLHVVQPVRRGRDPQEPDRRGPRGLRWRPGQLFYSTQIPACLWFIARDRKGGNFRERRGEILFIDARKRWTAPTAS